MDDPSRKINFTYSEQRQLICVQMKALCYVPVSLQPRFIRTLIQPSSLDFIVIKKKTKMMSYHKLKGKRNELNSLHEPVECNLFSVFIWKYFFTPGRK